jgi:triosephosphate isomerase
MRKKIVAGNWKMNLGLEKGKDLVTEILTGMPQLSDQHKVIICPPYIHLQQTGQLTVSANRVYTGAQNCYTEASGAYTGEVSADMIKSTGALFVILGHSERREYFNESNEMLAKKVDIALANNLQVIYCCGEPLAIRDANTQNSYVEQQIIEGIFHLDAEQLSHVTIAYEPIWAIGTGRTATSEQAQDMHAHIRSVIAGKYGNDVANSTSILYGGSCKPSNAAELFACPDVDGGLIGGASLNAADFLGIINAMAAQ